MAFPAWPSLAHLGLSISARKASHCFGVWDAMQTKPSLQAKKPVGYIAPFMAVLRCPHLPPPLAPTRCMPPTQ